MAKLKTHVLVGSHDEGNTQRLDWSGHEREFTTINVLGARRSGAVSSAIAFMDESPEFLEVQPTGKTHDKFVEVELLSHKSSATTSFNKRPYKSKTKGTYANTWPFVSARPLSEQLLSAFNKDDKIYLWVPAKDIVE